MTDDQLWNQVLLPSMKRQYGDGRLRFRPEALAVLARKGRAMFKEFRSDGWPLCPTCGEDELFSGLMFRWNGEGPRPTLDECFARDFGCNFCGYHTHNHE